jgi:hypothetical protein
MVREKWNDQTYWGKERSRVAFHNTRAATTGMVARCGRWSVVQRSSVMTKSSGMRRTEQSVWWLDLEATPNKWGPHGGERKREEAVAWLYMAREIKRLSQHESIVYFSF